MTGVKIIGHHVVIVAGAILLHNVDESYVVLAGVLVVIVKKLQIDLKILNEK